MKVRELMSSPAFACQPHESLAHAAQRMWEHDCGVLPVVDGDGRVRAAITDRDVCMGALLRSRPLTELQIGDSMSKTVVTCRADDDVQQAADAMAAQQLHRLPVVDEKGRLVGVLSLNDLARASDHDGMHRRHALRVLAAVSRPRETPVRERAAKQGARAVSPILIPTNGGRITVSHAVTPTHA